jgi:DNA-binding NarL/FixJ family response regulator
MAELRVVVADDHGVVCAGLAKLIDAEPGIAVVAVAHDGEAAVEQVRRHLPDIALVDMSMPKLSGKEVTEVSRRDCPSTRVIALTVHDDVGYLREMLDAGARGYVLKRSAGEDLIRAIRNVAAGGVYVDPQVASKIVGARIAADRGAQPPAAVALSDRETSVLLLIAEGYRNKEIAARLDVSVKTVETYKSRAMEKLGLLSRVDVVRYAARNGWLPTS